MTRTCCAHGCRSNTKKNPGLKFFDLSQAKGSLAEWLAAFPRRYRVDIVADITAGHTNTYSICEEHFSDSQSCQSPISIAESISINSDKSSQTDNYYSLAKLNVSPVEIVDIPSDTNYFPEFVAASNIPPINNINMGAYSGLTYNTNAPQKQTNIVILPELVSNINSMQPRSENTQLPAFYLNNNALVPGVQSSSNLNKRKKTGGATKNNLNPVRIRPKEKPRILKKNSKNTPELVINANFPSPNQQPNTNVVNIPAIPAASAATSFMQPAVYSVDPLLVEDTNAIRLSPNTNNNVSVDNALPCDVPIKVEHVDDRILQKNSQDTQDEQKQGVEIQSENSPDKQSENGPEEHRSDTIQIEYRTTDDSHTTSQEDEIVEDYVQFEIDESKEGNIETYCFFEDDSAKRRKVETDSTESQFRKVKVEIHPDADM